MGRYDVHVGVEGEYEPGSRGRVLRNLMGIKNKREMDKLEADALVEAQEHVLAVFDANSRLTAEKIQGMHETWLGRIYAWAGRYRTVEMAKGEFVWPPAYLVSQNMDAFERDLLLRSTPCHARSVAELTHVLAQVQAEFLLVHPFREGNGRMARWICDLMAMQAGHRPLEYQFTGRGGARNSKTYLQGVINGYGGNYEPLAIFLEGAIKRADLRALRDDNLSPRAPSK